MALQDGIAREEMTGDDDAFAMMFSLAWHMALYTRQASLRGDLNSTEVLFSLTAFTIQTETDTHDS